MNPLDYLYRLELHGIKLGLENIRRLLAETGDPHRSYPVVHVGGTNGKGSVVAILDAMLRAAGYRTGRFTSPHLITVRERFLVNGHLIADEALDEHIDTFRTIAEREGLRPTFFEVCTAVAFRHFAEQSVDIALIEVGMGGRFDSTNVVAPAVAVITNVALEHTKYLGDTAEAIAFEKAGIIKQNTPVVVGETHPGPRDVILKRASELEAPVRLLEQDFGYLIEGGPYDQRFSYRDGGLHLEQVPLALPGRYQGFNAALAVAAAQELERSFEYLGVETIEAGLKTARWPCRLERVLDRPEVIIDVAHNAAGAEKLAEALPRRCVFILAIANDKDAEAIIGILAEKADLLILTRFEGSRALPLDTLCERAGKHDYERVETLDEAIAFGVEQARGLGIPLVIAGSLFTAGQARQILTEGYRARPIAF